MTTWDTTVDLVIVGSGGGGMVAALTAADAGASALVLEKQERIGGSTAMSGGIVWVPNNPVMRAAGSRRLLRRRDGPLRGGCGGRRARLLIRTSPRLPDRRPEWCRSSRGAGSASCTAAATATTTRAQRAATTSDAGSSRSPSTVACSAGGSRLQPGLAQSLGLAVMTNEARSFSHYNRSLRAFAVSAACRPAHLGGTAAQSGAPDERCLVDRADAARRDRRRGHCLDRRRRSRT